MAEFAEQDLRRQLLALVPTPDADAGWRRVRARQRRFRQRRAAVSAGAMVALVGIGLVGVQLNGDGPQRVSVEVPADDAVVDDAGAPDGTSPASEPVRPDQIEGRSFAGGSVPRITFDRGTVTVWGGCFAAGAGTYDPSAGSVSIRWSSDRTVPAIGCDQPLFRQQQELSDWLTTSQLVWSDGQLVLTDGMRHEKLSPQPAALGSVHCVPGIAVARDGTAEDAPSATNPTSAFRLFAKVGATSADLLYPPRDPQVITSNADEAVLTDSTALGQPVLSARVVREGSSWSVRNWSGCSRTPAAAVLEQLSTVDWHVEVGQVQGRTFTVGDLTDSGADVALVAPITLQFSSTDFVEQAETCTAVDGDYRQPLPGWIEVTPRERSPGAICVGFPWEAELNAQRNILRGLFQRGRMGRIGDTLVVSDGQLVVRLEPV